MFATTVGRSNNAGASAIFKLFQVRPALLEKRIERPPIAAAAAAATAAAAAAAANFTASFYIQASKTESGTKLANSRTTPGVQQPQPSQPAAESSLSG
jgi:hypothetical protein